MGTPAARPPRRLTLRRYRLQDDRGAFEPTYHRHRPRRASLHVARLDERVSRFRSVRPSPILSATQHLGAHTGTDRTGVIAPPEATNVRDMDLKLDRLREVEFHQKLNGYNPREVDEFIDQVALAVEELLRSLHTLEATGHQLVARLQELEAAAPGGSWATAVEIAGATAARVDPERDSAFDQDTIARVLLVAQRTAELVISEAEESAHILREEAQASADRIVQQAETQAASVTEDARSAADASFAGLERERISLETRLAALRSRAIQHRDGLRDMLSDQLLTLDGWLTADTDPHLGQESLGPVPGQRPHAGIEVGGDADAPTVDLTLADLQAADVSPMGLPPPLTT